MARQPVDVQLFYNGQWNDAPAYERDQVVITRGRADEQSEPAPATVQLTLNNRTGTYNPSNPMSALYDKVGRNTPTQVVLDNPIVEGFEDATLDISYSDQNTPWLRTNTQAHTGSWSLRSGVIGDSAESRIWVFVPSGATQLTVWYRVSSEAGFDFFEIWLGTGTTVGSLQAVVQARSASGTVGWTQAILDVGLYDNILFRYFKDASAVAGEDAAYIDDLRFDFTRAYGEASSWRPDRTPGFTAGVRGDSWTSLTVSGNLQRLSQGADPLLSPIRRVCLSEGLVQFAAAYWPAEDEAGATRVASGLPGGEPLQLVGDGQTTEFAANSAKFPGSAPLMVLGVNSNLSGPVPSTVNTTGAIYFRMLMAPPDNGYIDQLTLMNLYCAGGTVARMALIYQVGGSLKVQAISSDGTVLAESAFFGLGIDGSAFYLSLEFVQDGADIDWLMSVAKLNSDGTVSSSLPTGTFTGQTVGRCVHFAIGGSGNMGNTVLGHMGVANSQSWFFATGSNFLTGYTGETAGARFSRLCGERNVGSALLGSAADTISLGPQSLDTFVNLINEVERTDGGLLYEPRWTSGIIYRTRVDLYNQAAKLTLNWTAGQVAPPLTPVLDDQIVRNDVTVNKPTGSNARAVQGTGRLNVQDPTLDPDGVGRYTTQVDVNPAIDGLLPHLASWYLHRGTVDDTRFPQVTVDLDASLEIAQAVGSVDIGDRIAITNTPIDISADDISLIVLGYTETISSRRRLITFNCVPASMFEVGVYDNTNTRFEGTLTELASSVTTTATSWSVNVNPLWTIADGSFSMIFGGEQVTVTNITGASSPQTFTVTRSVNGVVKSHAAGTSGRLFRQPRYAL